MQYETLNDAASCIAHLEPVLRAGTTKVWYQRPAQFSLQAPFDPASMERTHILLGEVAETSPERLFWALQGENWSPQGEAKSFIWGKSIRHTSMSVGDIVETEDAFHLVAAVGFRVTPKVKA